MKTINIYYTIVLLFVSFGIQSQCLTDTHSPFQNQGWLSCDRSASPNIERGSSHWILYDLGHRYVVDSLQLWNHNVWGETEYGAKTIIVDYSLDKITWQNAGRFDIAKAPGSWKYTVKDKINLNHAEGQYFLITVIETWSNANTCAGIAEVKFDLGISTDTKDIVLNESWSVYPNPASDFINVDLENDSTIELITITNNLGQVLESIKNVNQQKLIFPLERYNAGVYYITVYRNQKTEVKTFVKMDVK